MTKWDGNTYDPGRPWRKYALSYRAEEMRILADWIKMGVSGSVVGLSGVGKSNLLGFLCHRPDALATYLPEEVQSIVVAPVDLNNLPDSNLSALYRVILRSFYEIRERFEETLRTTILRLYTEHRGTTDPFLAQSALRELLFHFQDRGLRSVLVLDRFDDVCRLSTPEMSDSLRGLRDSFKDTVLYIAGMRQGVRYLRSTEMLGDLYQVLDTHVCYVGPLNEIDGYQEIVRLTALAERPPSDEEITKLFALTGGYPSLLKTASQWWLTTGYRLPPSLWRERLFAERSIQYRLSNIWSGLTQEEQLMLTVLYRTESDDSRRKPFDERYKSVMETLIEKGLCTNGRSQPRIFSHLFTDHVARVGPYSRGKLWHDPQTKSIYQGHTELNDLTPMERSVLLVLLQHPRERLTYSDIIDEAWAGEASYGGVSTESLYQVVRGLRQKIEPHLADPVYILNWRGKPEGGYQLFPEGRPHR